MTDLHSCRVLVTPTSFGRGDPLLVAELERTVGEVIYNPAGRPLTSAELCQLLPGCDGCIAGLDAIDSAALQAADRLRVIARYGVGVDNIDLAAARARGIVVTNTPGANAASVAELAVGLMLALARQIPLAHARTRAGEWPRLPGIALGDKTIGLLGFGAVGRHVARCLCGFGCTVLACDPAIDVGVAAEHGARACTQAELLAESDFLSLHLPLLEGTRGMVDAAFLSRMKHRAYLVNTARGELVDEAALLAALVSGHLAGAALDTLASEPPAPDDPLLALPQVILSPHIGAHTDGAISAMGRAALADCLAVLRHQTPRWRVI